MNMQLAPVIQSIEICFDEDNLPAHLKLCGLNLLSSQAAQIIVDGAFSSRLQGTPDLAGEALVRIPNPSTFRYNRTHQVIYTTADGVAFKRF